MKRLARYPLSGPLFCSSKNRKQNNKQQHLQDEYIVDLGDFVKYCDGTLHLERIALLVSRDVATLRYLLTETIPKDPRVAKVMFIRR